jgi:hypothetical protein
MLNFDRIRLLILAGSFAISIGAFATTALAQGATSSGSAGTGTAAGANSNGAAPGSPASSSSAMGSGITNPQPGANNDPALQDPKSGPKGAPGVSTESGSLDANGMHSNAAAPVPTP